MCLVFGSVYSVVGFFFFFKQKTAYEMRISDWSSDVCSSDLVHLYSPDGRYDGLYLRNLAVIQVRDRLARLPGAGDVCIFGSGDYAMRLWLDPQKLAARSLTVDEVIAAVREQNVQVAAGSIGEIGRASWRV